MKKVITILLVFLLWVCFVNAQCPKKDTIVYNQFRDYVEWSKSHQKKTLEDFENEKYQMIYFDKVIIDKKNIPFFIVSYNTTRIKKASTLVREIEILEKFYSIGRGKRTYQEKFVNMTNKQKTNLLEV